MKAKSGFVVGMKNLCGVSSVDNIVPEKIKADHVRLMYSCLTKEACDLLGDLAGEADDMYTDCVVMTEEQKFVKSGLASASVEERYLIEMIFASQGRRICFGTLRLVVSPSDKKILEKRRADLRAKAEAESKHHLGELEAQPA